MASGSGVYSEPRSRQALISRLLNADEDVTSTVSAPAASTHDRLNNWDSSNWKPNSSFENTKRPKRANEEKGEVRDVQKKRNKENLTVSSETSPLVEGSRHKTPSTFPRTKVTPVMPMSQRMALENLRQHITFSDMEESVDGAEFGGERNNERFLPRRERPVEMSLERNEVGKTTEPSRDNRNTQRQLEEAAAADAPDSTQIVGRLMQIRGYIKESSSMMEKLQASGDPSDHGRATQLEQVINRLREQEQKYLELLLKLSTAKEDLLERQNSLQKATDGPVSQLESESEAATELEVDTDTSENEDAPEASGITRPRIEDKLGLASDTEQDGQNGFRTGSRTSQPETPELDATLVSDPANVDAASAELLVKRKILESDLSRKNEELAALKEQHDLLRKMLDQQEQLRDLQGRQASLMMLQKEAESHLEREAENAPVVAPQVGSSLAVQRTLSDQDAEEDEGDDVDFEDPDVVPQELRDLRQRLDYLKNLYERTEQQEDPETTMMAATDTHHVLSEEKAQLQNKLAELLQQKNQMDQLLGDLQSMKGQTRQVLNNEMGMEIKDSSPQQLLRDGALASAATGGGSAEEEEAERMWEVMEARTKLKKLQEVKDRLNQLKGLVHYYQTGNGFIHGQPAEMPPPQPEVTELRGAKQTKKQPSNDGSKSAPKPRNIPPQVPDSEGSESGSQISSSLDVWGDDPVIQEKVRRLKEAKEKLHRLQDLVAMVQSSPDGAQQLPEDLAELAASLEMESGMSSRGGGERERREGSLSLAGAVAAGYGPATTDSELQYDQQEAFYQLRMTEQKSELESLMQERKKLLSLQQELQRLHDTIPQQPKAIPPKVEKQKKKKGSPSSQKTPPTVEIAGMELLNNQDFMQTSPNNRQLAEQRAARATVESGQTTASVKAPESMGVTFQEPLETVISNEELYGRMRQQRMLREELREKKKELEDMMRKDRPRKQYSRNQDHQRNQDNQSDNISYSNRSTELFGGSASVDQTMATWGGSTVDNLESIEEDEGNSGDGQEADDDGYPSDGIVQVEEEEEQVALEDSDDRDTYTIEEEPYIPKTRTSRRQTSPPNIEANARTSSKKSSGAPFQGSRSKNGYNYWDPDNNQVLNNVRASSSKARSKKRDKTSDLQDEIKSLKEQIESLKESVMTRSTPNLNQDPVMNQNLAYMSSLQQQQMMLSLSQFHSQMMSSQQEMGDRLGRLERSFSTSREFLNHSDMAEATRRPYNSHQNSPRDAIPPQMRGSLPHYLDTYAAFSNSANGNPSRRNNSFELSPFFPDGFTRPSEENSLQESPIGLSSRPTGLINNTNNNHLDALRLDSVLNRDLDKDRNPFRTTPYRSSSMDAFAVKATTGEEPDAVPIETIHAQDTREGGRRIPRLNLDRLVKEKDKRSDFSKAAAFLKPASAAGVSVTPSKETAVIGEKFPTPSRASAAARLASQKVDGGYRPGVSAGISGTAYNDAASVSSAVSSEPGGEDGGAARKQQQSQSDPVDFNLFEALRETIYSEVATLISQNESRPHYLIELFRELQLMASDYLRQRALYAIQDLATQQLTEESLQDKGMADKQEKKMSSKVKKSHQWPQEAVTSELTPSLSAFTSEEEDVKAKLYGQNPRLTSAMRPTQPKGQTYDYNENVEDSSFLNTPDSACFESPFAQDSLGDTVIHMDKSLQRMKKLQLATDSTSQDASPMSLKSDSGLHPGNAARQHTEREPAASAAAVDGSLGSSAQDNGSEGSVSDVAYPRIDTQHLDQQIKAIMTEIIPVLNEHMEDVCSQQLLSYIKRLVLSLAQHVGGDQGHEFVRFFNKQLGSILQDSLSKFDGRKMRDCGEDLLVDLSEILFNELAFFRLMQDLDDPKVQAMTNPPTLRQGASSEGVSQLTQTVESFPPDAGEEEEDSSGDESDTESSSEIDERDRLLAKGKQEMEKTQEVDSIISNTEEEEQLGKARDDEMAAQTLVTREEEDDEDVEEEVTNGMMKIQLAPSETKPMTRIGSDEDDEGEDETYSYEDPSDTAVSHDFGTYSHDDMAREYTEEGGFNQPEPLFVNDHTKEEMEKYTDNEKEIDTTEVLALPGAVVIDNPMSVTSSTENHVTSTANSKNTENAILQPVEGQHEASDESGSPRSSQRNGDVNINEIKLDEEQRDSSGKNSPNKVSQAEVFQEEASPGAANSTVIEVNGEVADSQEDVEEEGALTVDDLPAKLNVNPVPKPLDGEQTEGASGVTTDSVLQHVEETVTTELAGDPQALKEPGTGCAKPV